MDLDWYQSHIFIKSERDGFYDFFISGLESVGIVHELADDGLFSKFKYEDMSELMTKRWKKWNWGVDHDVYYLNNLERNPYSNWFDYFIFKEEDGVKIKGIKLIVNTFGGYPKQFIEYLCREYGCSIFWGVNYMDKSFVFYNNDILMYEFNVSELKEISECNYELRKLGVIQKLYGYNLNYFRFIIEGVINELEEIDFEKYRFIADEIRGDRL